MEVLLKEEKQSGTFTGIKKKHNRRRQENSGKRWPPHHGMLRKQARVSKRGTTVQNKRVHSLAANQTWVSGTSSS